MPDVLVRTDPATITDGIDATAWLRGLLSYGVEERLLLPVLLYRAARDAGISDRSTMTSTELRAALASN